MPPAPTADRPLVIVGGGPIGLAAAAEALERGLPTTVVEREVVGHAVREWGHVRLFSAWSELVAPAARRLLEANGWQAPDDNAYPTGRQWVEHYLQPLADALIAAGVQVRTQTTVSALTRAGRDRAVNSGRDLAPFALRLISTSTPTARPERLLASAVIDASGTWLTPHPLGSEGLPAVGETAAAPQITYGIPDLREPTNRARFAGRHVFVAGTGASAQNVLVALADLLAEDAATRVTWAMRRHDTDAAFGGEAADQLQARGALGASARVAAAAEGVSIRTGFRALEVVRDAEGRLEIIPETGEPVAAVDEVIVVTGFRPDLSWLGEVRLDLDPVLSAPRALAPLIDPNEHSCGTVYPHGTAELAQPDPGLYLAGMKSYGRATSFLALTGFEQVRSIVAEIAGDHEAAARVELVLPESGVCGGAGTFDALQPEGGECCGAPVDVTLSAPTCS